MSEELPSEGQVDESPPQPPPEPPTVLLRATRNPRRIDGWGLVLLAQGMHPLLRWVDGVFELRVQPEEAAFAQAELQAAEREEAEARRALQVDARVVEPEGSRWAPVAGALVALSLLAFFGVTGPRAAEVEWFATGASEAARVVHGEWWRTITALTLHADIGHVLSNVAIAAVVVSAVMWLAGMGWGGLLVLLSGAFGNGLNALVHRQHHSSVGFSTAVFGAVGILGGLAFVRASRQRHRTRPAWTALAGAMGFLALMGASERSDVLAHLFGGTAGVVLGLVVGWRRWRPGAVGQWLAAVIAMSAVLGAWWRALC